MNREVGISLAVAPDIKKVCELFLLYGRPVPLLMTLQLSKLLPGEDQTFFVK